MNYSETKKLISSYYEKDENNRDDNYYRDILEEYYKKDYDNKD